MIDITFWLIESKSKVYAVYLMEPLASQLINKSKKRLLELMNCIFVSHGNFVKHMVTGWQA
jgi:hypothetical protein